MTTDLIRIDPARILESDVARAAEAIRTGGLVGFPTETVYGIAVRADDEEAIGRLFDLKGRPAHKPFAYHIPDTASLEGLVPEIPALARRLVDRYWPGPLTLVLPGPGGTKVGIRLPGHPVARRILRAAGVRVLGTSANRAGNEPAVTGQQVLEEFPDQLACVVDSGRADLCESSTVVEIDGDTWKILRGGFIDARAIRNTLSRGVLLVCSGNTCRSPMAAALLRRLLARKIGVPDDEYHRSGIVVESAGIAALPGGSASYPAVETMKESGIDLGPHETRRLTADLVESAELVLAMTQDQVRLIRELAPEHSDKIFLLDPTGANVIDPFGSSMETYRSTAREIQRSLERWLDRILDTKGAA
jgi:tRNA threonylcarbamoyl adenosine modification protein (Sua5/YciO/YrdC/YwlC family)